MSSTTASSEHSSAQYILQSEQPQQQTAQQQGSEDMFFALERLLMGISPFPPSIPTLAKPTCPSLDDQLMAEISATTSPTSIPSIVLNEQSLDLLQQFYQNQDSTQTSAFQFQQQQQHVDHSDCSSTSRSVSPPASPYSYASSLVSSPAMPMQDFNCSSSMMDPFWMSPPSNTMIAAQQQPQEWDSSLFDQMSLPLTMTGLENFIAPSATENNNNSTSPFLQLHTTAPAVVQPKSLKQSTTSTKRSKANHHRRSSSSCSAISAYESTAHREHRASSISSVCSAASTTSTSTTPTTLTRPVKSYACSTCSKPFPTRTQLKSHMAIHTDSFPFPCVYAGCDLHFKRKHDLRRHVDAKHALVKKYLCTGGCGEGFGRRDQMVRHLRRGACGQGQGFQTE
ncbi:hypothetical protein BG011_002946 [Mortierella polycephala]|uniref:C2H2-type domain-containing protein n=1 Tax=Mortierella polycephala TaxID=41804 RepID=A0A9P6UA88_9FUNG|nr:hypothetical protein BG011_002946 [Mortierella polycephala]